MPADEPQLDYPVQSDYKTDTNEPTRRVLLVAAATEMVESFVDSAMAAGVQPSGIDLIPFAVARAEGRAAPDPQREISGAGKKVVIIGGGDTGMDCLSSANREGAESALFSYAGLGSFAEETVVAVYTDDQSCAHQLCASRGTESDWSLREHDDRVANADIARLCAAEAGRCDVGE